MLLKQPDIMRTSNRFIQISQDWLSSPEADRGLTVTTYVCKGGGVEGGVHVDISVK